MTDYQIIQNEITAIKQKYTNSVLDIISDYNNENKTKTDYRRRQIYELLQNADDCYSDEYPQISVRMELTGHLLIIQNNGTPFSARGILSLMHTDASSKHEGTIGCKGLGFRSVLNWANRIAIYTKNFHVDFSEERAFENLKYYRQQTGTYGCEELNRLDRTAVLTAAEVNNDKEEIDKWLMPGFSTSIVLYCNSEYINEIDTQLRNLKFEELLFLKHIDTIEILTENVNRKIETNKENEMCIIQESDSISQWRVWNRQDKITLESGDSKQYELTIAYNDDEVARNYIRKNGVLYSYFKTDIPISFPFLIHGTFELTSERNDLVKDSQFNELVIEKLIDFIGEIGEGLINNAKKCDYEALNFLLPSESLGKLDREYDFTRRLKSRIKEYRIFPTINNEYISINESPRYSPKRFDEILCPSTFLTLLKRTDDIFIVNYINEVGITFYSEKELVELINKDAQYYVNNKTNEDLIVLFCNCFHYPSNAPKLLTDGDGNLILDENIKVFDNPKQKLQLPEWSRMCFLNSALEIYLSKQLNAQGRSLTDKLKAFNVVEYSFNRVLAELVSQSKDDLGKTKGAVRWLYEYWEQNDHTFPSDFNKTEIRVVTRNQEIVGASKCFLGKEYGNDLGERLTYHSESAIYVGAPDQIGLSDKNLEEVKAFFYSLGVNEYPTVEITKLGYHEQKEYISYNIQHYRTLVDNRQNSYSHDTFFSQWDREISVANVKNIDIILKNADFYDIVCWLLNDTEIYAAVTNVNEIRDSSSMKGKPAYAQQYHIVSKYYMASWLRKKITEAEWLPTQSGKKVAVNDCTLLPHKLSPIVEVLDVDYAKLVDLSGKSRKEIELLFEKLGIAEDVVDLSPTKIYEIMLALYNNQVDPVVARQFYAKLNIKFKSEMLNGLIFNNPMYEKFKTEGGVLAEQDGKFVYLPVNEVFYVDKKIYSEDILNNYPLLVLGKRAGAAKIEKLFCVKSIQATGEIKVDYKEHDLNNAYQKEFQKFLPYIYAKRISVDNKNKEINALKSARIVLVKEASAVYRIGNAERKGTLQDYELIYSDKVAYIKIPSDIRSISILKDSAKFRGAVAEVVTTILDVDGDKDAFLIILACKSTKEADEYFIENGDDDLTTVNLSKSKFTEQIDREVEFWNAISNALGVMAIDRAKYVELMSAFDYYDLNCISNCKPIIELFKSLGINIDQYNQYAYELIDLQSYYKEQLRCLKLKYREKYFLYLLQKENPVQTKYEFEEEKQKYDEIVLSAPNSVEACLDKIYENNLHVQLSDLDNIEGDLNDLLQNLRDDTQISTLPPPNSPKPLPPVDYYEIDSKIASQTNEESKKAELSPMNSNIGKMGGGNKGGGSSYGMMTTKAKEEHGFLAESKVYHTLCSRLGMKGSVVWVSENGHRANANADGNDNLGYDIWYSDENSKKHYVEVKGSTSENVEFVLTKNELEFAEQHPNDYEIWYVRIIDGQPDIPYELGNLLMLEEEETFFKNSKFAVENNDFKIRAKLCEPK